MNSSAIRFLFNKYIHLHLIPKHLLIRTAMERYIIAMERLCDVNDEGEMTNRKIDAMCREFSFH